MTTSNLIAKYGGTAPRYTSYPTAPQFHAGIGAATYAGWLEALPAETPLSLYIHVPFCNSLCWFCGCHTRIVNRYAPIGEYLERLVAEIDLVADRLGDGRPVRHVHWGGGTPTMASPDDILRLTERLRARFDFGEDTAFAIEIDPRVLTAPTVQALAEAGVTRASLGVQDVNAEVQSAVNRIQPLAVTERAVAQLRSAGINSINVDIMYGLPHQTTERAASTAGAVLGLAPDRVAVFGYAHVPWMKRHQRLIDEAALPGAAERLAQFDMVAARLRLAGYRAIGIDHFARPDDPLAIAAEEGRLHRNFQGYTTDDCPALLGFGASAIGALPQGYVQNEPGIREWANAVRAGRPSVVRGTAVSVEDRIRRAVIERLMCDFAVDLAAIRASLNTPLSFDRERAALTPMVEDGIVRLDGDRITVIEAGRPFVRAVCAVFDAYIQSGSGRYSRAV